MQLAPSGLDALHVHVWQPVPAFVAVLRMSVYVEGAIVNELRIPFEPDGTHQMEDVGDLACGTEYTVLVAACSEDEGADGGCSTPIRDAAKTAPCRSPPPLPPLPSPPALPQHPAAPPRAPPSSPLLTQRDHGCKDPTAVTFDPTAQLEDASLCLPGVWGCTLPSATNYEQNANMNDGSCRFESSRCAVPLTREPLVALAGTEAWPVSVNRSSDGKRPCQLPPAVGYDRCLSVVPPEDKSVDVVVSYPLPPRAVEATVEVGLDPAAGRQGNAEFELRVVSELGELVASDLAVRARTGEESPAALLRVVLDSKVALRSAMLLQLVVNDVDGSAASDLAVWADPMLYCEGSCPCSVRQEYVSSSATREAGTGDSHVPSSDGDSSSSDASESTGGHVAALLGGTALLAVLCAAGAMLACCRRSRRASLPRVSKVQMVRRMDHGDESSLMSRDFDDASDDDYDATGTARAGDDDDATAIPKAHQYLE